MDISSIGGEFELIKRLCSKKITDSKIIAGIGDDCAVLEYDSDNYLIVTTDMIVEDDHFSLKYSTPFQIGMKLMEVNVSDIVSMGGTPKYAFISLSLKKDTTVEFMDELYKGLHSSAEKHGISIVGGDTTHGTEYVFNLCLLGEVNKKLLCLRSMAKPGDIVCVTGMLGGSTAGLKLLLNKKQGYLIDHLEPKSRTVTEAQTIARYANAMIDVSDGLGSEVKHICEASNVGARIDFEKIPLSKQTINSAKTLSLDPYDFALYGGEDFELVFTISSENLEKLKKEFSDFTVVGKILEKSEGTYVLKENKKLKIGKGYDHFS